MTESMQSFIDRLASSEPTPGGGAAAGVAGSLGTAAILMAIRFSTNSKKLTEDDVSTLETAIEKLEASRARFLELNTEDEEGFKPLSDAFSMPKSTEKEEEERTAAIQKGLVTASKAPEDMIQEVEKSVTVVEGILPLIKKGIVSDIGVGVQLLRSALNASQLNVLINVRMLIDEAEKAEHQKIADDLVEDTTKRIDQVFNQVQDKISG